MKRSEMRSGFYLRRATYAGATVLGAILMSAVASAAEFIKPEEMQQRSQWAREHLLAPGAKMPFSFVYDEQASDGLLTAWPRKARSKKVDAVRTRHTISWVDPGTMLEVRCVAVEYSDYSAVEWVVYLKNTGTNNTPILRDIQGLDTVFKRQKNGEFILNGIKGDSTTADSYEPYQLKLSANVAKRFAPLPGSGKSSSGPDGWPYYNLQIPGGGVILALGWPGQWSSSFERDHAKGLRIKAGQELTHLFLEPNEEIRTPLIAMLFWQGTDIVRAQNLWRRWYLAHILPRVNGQPQPPVTQIQVGGSNIAHASSYLDAGIRPVICWRDSNWYPNKTGPYKGDAEWLNTGTWEIDPTRYPDGFKPFSDWVRAHGMQFLLWFEPERVGDPNSWLAKNHPEWLLPGTSHGSLLDEGNPAALRWLIDHVDGMIKSQGIDWYREDMNGNGPLPAWRRNDTVDRQGATENHYVQGHLAFWDELRRRNPGLRIDSCASGGRRNDLETMRRAVPLTRSDFHFSGMKGVVEGNQGHTYGLSFWLPFQGIGDYFYDTYSFRSFYLPSFGMAHGLNPDNTRAQKQAYSECSKVAPYMLFGDYYPLTGYSLQHDQWIAWQFNRPDQGGGVVQAFRRGKCDESTKTFRLGGLDRAVQYEVTNFDIAGSTKLSGKDLLERGLTVEIKDKPGAVVVVYQKVK